MYEISDYYTASEVAEILGLDKNTILYRCKKGWYDGAIKTEPSPGDPHGKWLVPKRLIDVSTMTKEVANLTRQINPLELERAIANAITHAITIAVEPLNNKLDEQNIIIQQQSKLIQELQNENAKNMVKNQDESRKLLNNISSETRQSLINIGFEIDNLKPRKSKKGFFARIFGD